MQNKSTDERDDNSEVLKQFEERLESQKSRELQNTIERISISEIKKEEVHLILKTTQSTSVKISTLAKLEGKSRSAAENIEVGEEPKVLLFLVALAYGPEKRDEIQDFMYERYRKDIKKFGRAKAKMLLARDIADSYSPVIKAIFRRSVVRVCKVIGIYQIIKKYFPGN